MANLAQTPPPGLQELADRAEEMCRLGGALLAEAADLREMVRRAEAATGVPLLPVRHSLSLVPPAA